MYYETIKQTLLPRFENLSYWKSEEVVNNMRNSFESHIKLMSNYFESYNNFPKKLDIDLFVWFHKLLYPAWFEIKAIWNDNISHVMYPWEWRKQYLARYKNDFSEVKNIEKDFQKIIDNFNNLETKTREDILRFYLDFGKVHPFWDSNWVVSAVISDLLFMNYWFKPINILKLRYKDKNYWYELVELSEQDWSNENLSRILDLIDEFNVIG